jgi:hypothetical protein
MRDTKLLAMQPLARGILIEAAAKYTLAMVAVSQYAVIA